MKKTFSIITTVLLVVFLISALFTIVGCTPGADDVTKKVPLAAFNKSFNVEPYQMNGGIQLWHQARMNPGIIVLQFIQAAAGKIFKKARKNMTGHLQISSLNPAKNIIEPWAGVFVLQILVIKREIQFLNTFMMKVVNM